MADVKTDVVASSELVQKHLAKSHVVRGLSNMDFVRLLTNARPKGAADRSALPIAGDSPEAKATVTEFLDKIGYDVVDMGPIRESWRSEPTMPVYVHPYISPEASYMSKTLTWRLSCQPLGEQSARPR